MYALNGKKPRVGEYFRYSKPIYKQAGLSKSSFISHASHQQQFGKDTLHISRVAAGSCNWNILLSSVLRREMDMRNFAEANQRHSDWSDFYVKRNRQRRTHGVNRDRARGY